MITYVRFYSIMPGKTPDALATAHKIKKHAKDKHGFEVNLMMPIGGNPNRIAFVSTADHLADLEGAFGKIEADAEFQKLTAGNVIRVPSMMRSGGSSEPIHGNKRVHNADEMMAEIVVKRLVEHLERVDPSPPGSNL
jgi:hypothetical protein